MSLTYQEVVEPGSRTFQSTDSVTSGGAGTNGFAGAAGSGSIIIVDEFYQ